MSRKRWNPSRVPRHETGDGRFKQLVPWDEAQFHSDEMVRRAEWIADIYRCCVLVSAPVPGMYQWYFERGHDPVWIPSQIVAVCHPYREAKRYRPGGFLRRWEHKAFKPGHNCHLDLPPQPLYHLYHESSVGGFSRSGNLVSLAREARRLVARLGGQCLISRWDGTSVMEPARRVSLPSWGEITSREVREAQDQLLADYSRHLDRELQRRRRA